MKVILLCAGYATRLYPLTQNNPKPLLPVGGRPILEWILARVEELRGVDQIFIVTNHRFAQAFSEWAKKAKMPWPLEVVDDKTTNNENRLGAIGDLNFVLTQKKIHDDLLVLAGDNLFDFDLREFVKFAQKTKPHAALALFDVKDKELAKRYGLVRVDKMGQILEFYEKPEHPPTTLASCGIYWLPAASLVLLDRYLAAGHNSDQPGHFMRWLAETDRLFAVPLKGHWWDIGDLDSYEKANAHFKEFKSKIQKENL